jgi:hypothetical protein
MKREPPDLRELIGDDVPPDELERLGRVDRLLRQAGPPPDLPGELAAPPRTGALAYFPVRSWRTVAALAAALALAAFGVGWLAGANQDSESSAFGPVDFTVPMHGTRAAPNGVASLTVFERDESGNWPMSMSVRGLPTLPEGEVYEVWLTRDGRLADSCGTFVAEGTAVVPLNVPYRLRQYDGWVVTREGEQEILLRTTEI